MPTVVVILGGLIRPMLWCKVILSMILTWQSCWWPCWVVLTVSFRAWFMTRITGSIFPLCRCVIQVWYTTSAGSSLPIIYSQEGEETLT